jgi:hypothetical protein
MNSHRGRERVAAVGGTGGVRVCVCVCVGGDRGLLQLCNEDFGPLSLVVGFDNMGVLCLSHNTLYV